MASARAACLVLLALADAASAGSMLRRRQLDTSGALLQAFVPQEPPALADPAGAENRQSEGGFSPQIPNFQAGSSLPPADENSAGFFQMPPGFPNMASLSGFADQFQDSPNAVNNIDVPGIQFPASPFQSRFDDEPQPVFQDTPAGSN
ncbi:uncharacterized protein LOC122373704 [Amphibalanus amphitrite]|uniref:uncharacterized protein LOC122373704 n=1 Tax=Amphibalanus amphitrite TaxID=1232801 RepID=UPI001C8FF631|nr:uncharacterized protein LOC122373704 [Amphibalanus amphitrite]